MGIWRSASVASPKARPTADLRANASAALAAGLFGASVGAGPGAGPPCAAGQPRGPPVRPRWAPARGDPAGGRAEVPADRMGPAAAVRAARTRAVRPLPTDLQHRAAVHRGVAFSVAGIALAF